MVTSLLSVCVFTVFYRTCIRKYVMIFQALLVDFRSLKMKRFSMSERDNRIDR